MRWGWYGNCLRQFWLLRRAGLESLTCYREDPLQDLPAGLVCRGCAWSRGPVARSTVKDASQFCVQRMGLESRPEAEIVALEDCCLEWMRLLPVLLPPPHAPVSGGAPGDAPAALGAGAFFRGADAAGGEEARWCCPTVPAALLGLALQIACCDRGCGEAGCG